MPKTRITIEGEKFHINGEPTYKGRVWNGYEIESLLLNNRLVQATFDDDNPDTRSMWAYPDTGEWDAERNVSEFVDALRVYRDYGVLGITINFQGGNPKGYGWPQPWENNAFTEYGELKHVFKMRMKRVLDRMDELGMVAILGMFYFGQDERLQNEVAVVRAFDNAILWVLEQQ